MLNMHRKFLRCAPQLPIMRIRVYSAVPLPPSIPQQALNLAKAVLLGRARLYAAGAVLCAGAAYALWCSESEAGIVSGMCGVLEAGGRPGWDADYYNDANASVERLGVDNDLAALLLPSSVTKYEVIVGPSGTGKSTSVRKLVRKSKGVLYFSTRELIADFSLDLASAVGYRTPIDILDRLRRLVTGETKEQTPAPLLALEPRATWSLLSRMLRKAASLYHVKHGKAPTLVLDAMDLVAKSDPAFFAQVQDFAKACADAGVLRVVFVFSDGSALPLLLSSSAETRCDTDQICEVGDISDAEAEAYVVRCFGRTPKQAAELVRTVTGGRFPLLQTYGKSARPLADIRRELDNRTLANLTKVGVPLTHPLLRALLSKGALSSSDALALMPAAQIEGLLRFNVLAAHPSGTYSLNNRWVQRLVREALSSWWQW
jgi:hypothetical protein